MSKWYAKKKRRSKRTEFEATVCEESLKYLGKFCDDSLKRHPLKWQGRKEYMKAIWDPD